MNLTNWTVALASIAMGCMASGCSREAQAYTPQQLQQQYGITGAYAGQVATPDGAMPGTVVPVTLPDGRSAQLIIPSTTTADPHAMYINDGGSFYPVSVQPNVTRSQLVSS